MPVITDSPTPQQPIAKAKRLKTHCLIIGNQDHGHANVAYQTEPIDAVTVVSSSQVTPMSAALANVKNDVVLFLQNGDRWTDDFVAQISAVYQKHPTADVIYCDSILATKPRDQTNIETDAFDLGFSAVATYLGLNPVVPPLSCFTIRRRVLERILPLINDPDWHDQPAACLSIAASLASAHTFHLPLPLVHAEHIPENPVPADFAHQLKIMRLVGKIANQLGLNPDFVKQFLVMEYTSQPKNPETITKYCHLLQAHHPDTRSRREILLSMYRKMKDHLHGDGSLRGYAHRWWLKQKLHWTGKLSI